MMAAITMTRLQQVLLLTQLLPAAIAWVTQTPISFGRLQRSTLPRLLSTSITAAVSGSASSSGSLHGQNACFLPLKQLDQDSYSPRIVQIAGAYPGLTREEYYAVSSEPPPVPGQWSYDFSDPDGPQLGTVAIEGSNLVASCEDPVVIIAEHFALGVELPKVITEPVDLVVLVDRAKNRFGERRFLVLDNAVPGTNALMIAAYNSKSELPAGCEIIGQVDQVQVPWLPGMAPTKTGFLEADEYV